MTDTPTRPRRRWLKLVLLAACLVAGYLRFGGPLQTGAIFFLLPSFASASDHDMAGDYRPRHKGSIYLSNGLYVRVNEDLAVAGTPLVLRRTYLSRYHDKRQFGVGATHAGEWWLYPEDPLLRRVSLIREDGSRIGFDRTSSGSSFFNAMFQQRDSPTTFRGARLGWTGSNWAMRAVDGSVIVFQACGPSIAEVCSIVRSRDADGHTTYYRRDGKGRLTRMEFGDQWIALDYDGQDRITRAVASNGSHVRYEYDGRSRLTSAVTSGQQEYRYTYTDNDELATISEPNATIENYYDDKGYCIRQVNRFPDTPEPYVYQFSYRLDGTKVAETETQRSDGSWERLAFDRYGHVTAEAMGGEGEDEIAFTYERDPISRDVQSVSLTCAGRGGHRMKHSSAVRDGDEEGVKADLVQTHCRRDWRRARPQNERLDAVDTGLKAPQAKRRN